MKLKSTRSLTKVFLKQERRHVQGAVESAINEFVLCALGDTE
jgi:hypothetical protein